MWQGSKLSWMIRRGDGLVWICGAMRDLRCGRDYGCEIGRRCGCVRFVVVVVDKGVVVWLCWCGGGGQGRCGCVMVMMVVGVCVGAFVLHMA